MQINGYSIHGIKTFNSLDGGGYEAYICYEEEKICEVYDEGKGSPPILGWEITLDADKWQAAMKEHEPILTEFFIADLYDYYEDEKEFSKMLAKNPDGVLVKVCIEDALPELYTVT